MKFIKKSIMFAIIIALIAGALVFYFNGLQDVEIKSFILTGLEDVSTQSFSVTGDLQISNPSQASVPIKSLEYDVILVETGEVIGSGRITPFTLVSGSNKAQLSQQINWVPSVSLAQSLLLKDKVMIEVVGELFVNLPKVSEMSIPFSAQTDIREYVLQFVPGGGIIESLPLDESTTVLEEPKPDVLDDVSSEILG